MYLRDGIITSVGPLQICAVQESGCEAAIHAMSKLYKEEPNEAVLLVDAANAFNSVNRMDYHHVYLSLEGQRYNLLKEQRKAVLLQCQSTRYQLYQPPMLMVLEITNTKTNSDAKMVAYADISAAGSIFEFAILVGYIFPSLKNHG